MRESDGIYQKDKLVARVREPEVNEGKKEVRFAEVYESDDLLLPDECEFEKYIVLVREVESATKVGPKNRPAPRKLCGVRAEIVGYREH